MPQRAPNSPASATVHRYLGALPGAARADADALWTGGHPSPVPDDAVLRGITNIQSMRINNDPPIALDQQHPPKLIEVPVQLTVHTTTGTQRLVGAYRLQPVPAATHGRSIRRRCSRCCANPWFTGAD